MNLKKVNLFALFILLLAGCSEGDRSVERKPELVYSSEEEKLLNDVFLSILGTYLYYEISEKDWERVVEIEEEEGRDKANAYYEKHRKEVPEKLVVFTRDEFLDIYTSDFGTESLNPQRLLYIQQALEENYFIEEGDTVTQILEILSQPLELSSVNLIRTGRYQVLREQDKDKVEGEYKKYGSFNMSKIYINATKGKAAFFYERNCMDGGKCAAGVLVVLKKEINKWRVTKQITLYQS